MGRLIALLCCGLLATGAAPKATLIPTEYQGSWSMDPAYCNVEGDTMDSELYVTADTVGFHAEDHRVKSAKVHKGKVTLRYFPLKDATRVAPKTLSLSENGTKLNNLWHRCPEPKSEEYNGN